ncbi:MAG: hypothetical protein M3R24_10140 [Chloroflexota bacterium]|nr:hypothetical protein [Chloroflexota bacterium]
MPYTLHIVTGAPGAGKSTALNHFLRRHTAYLAFDIDWLLEAASSLVATDIRFAPSTWKSYTTLWFEILGAIHRNGKTPVLFAPIDIHDITRYGQPVWCRRIEWLLLDCSDAIRRQRLAQRPGWTVAMLEEAMMDAQVLRQTVQTTIDTGILSPDEVAGRILRWLAQTRPGEEASPLR